MAKIFYSLAGEGRGHAARVRSVVEMLRNDHEVTIFAPEEAYEFLAPRYSDSNVRVQRIPGLILHYVGQKLDFWKTQFKGVEYLWGMRGLIADLTATIRREKPDLVITDFEPALPRAAQRAGVPFVSLNHQHFLIACDLSSLPAHLRRHAQMMSWFVWAYYSGQIETVVSSFFFPPIKRGHEHVALVGPMLRPEVLAMKPESGEHVVAYLRKNASLEVLDVLKKLSREVRVYGLGSRPSEGNVHFQAIHEQRFLDDLASCAAVIGAAGNQLLGESLYLRKPVLAIPEAGHHEQQINAHYLREGGAGDFVTLEHLTLPDAERFLDRRQDFVGRLDSSQLNGNPRALAIIEQSLARTAVRSISQPSAA